ncbi:hypothetical protein KI387_042179, partial [Taxus chinensis]
SCCMQMPLSVFDPKQDDFHGVRSLLKTYCDGIDWDLSGFVDMILAQTTVGTVIKTDEDSLFGVITAINLARYKGDLVDQLSLVPMAFFSGRLLLDKTGKFFSIGFVDVAFDMVEDQHIFFLAPFVLAQLYRDLHLVVYMGGHNV